MALPTDPKERKNVPIASAFLDYFPDAVTEVAELSFLANEQHNPGKPVAWDRDKSGDEADALMRHFMERGTIDTDGIRHSAKVAWRALALLQKELEAAYGLPLPRGARSSETKNAREAYQEAVYESEIPEEDYGNSLATEPFGYWCDLCGQLHDRFGNYVENTTPLPSASFPPYIEKQDAAVGTMAGVERGEVVGVSAERAQSQGQPLAPEVRSVERIKEAVFGTKQAPEV